MKYFQIMAHIGTSKVHIEEPHASEESALKRVRQLYKTKPQYLIAAINTTAIGVAEPKKKKPRRKP